MAQEWAEGVQNRGSRSYVTQHCYIGEKPAHLIMKGMMPDSTFEILGRVDTQIKLRGVRIESEGISAIIRKAASPSARINLDAITILANHPKIGTDQLVSFIAWDPTITISTRKASLPSMSAPPQGLLESIQSVCAAELASYMRPSHIVPLQFLPLSTLR